MLVYQRAKTITSFTKPVFGHFRDSCTNPKHHRPGYWSALLSQRGPPSRDGRVQNGDFMSQPWGFIITLVIAKLVSS